MPAEEQAIAALLTDFSSRVKTLEERYNLIRERFIVLAQSFVKQDRELRRELKLLESDFKEMRKLIENMREQNAHIISELSNFVRRDELQALEKYIKLWDPIKFVKENEVEAVVEKVLRKKKEEKMKKDKEKIR